MRFLVVIGIWIVVLAYYLHSINRSMSRLPVVVVGSGLAGLTTAYHLVVNDAPVIVLEKLDRVGGNSIKASSGINGMSTATQFKKGVQDSFEDFFMDTSRSGGALGDSHLQEVLVNDSTNVVSWLQKDIGVPLDIINRLGGHSKSRTHRSSYIPPGYEIISKLKTKLDSSSKPIKFIFNAKLTDIQIELIEGAGKIRGLEYEDLKSGKKNYIKTNHVIMTTGGFAYSKELIKRFNPKLQGLPTTNGEQAMGDGLLLMEKIGAGLIDMDQIQVHPTGFVDPSDPNNGFKILAAESLRGVGGILLNEDKLQRFTNELSTRDVVSSAILEQRNRRAYLILSREMYEAYQFQVDFYISRGLMSKTTVKEKFGDRSPTVIDELDKYSDLEQHDETGRLSKHRVFDGVTENTTLYIGEITPVIHYTMGGVRIDENAHVLREDGAKILGLYAAGETSGGVHGKNRLAGNSLLECAVFGKRAARSVLASARL